MNMLVTGGAGFIGSHLAERLIRDGHKVIVIDNLSTGSLENIEILKNNPNFSFLKADVCDSSSVTKAVQSCDYIFHLAAAVGVRLIAERPVHTIQTNIDGTRVMLEAANRFKKKIFIASTSEVYGKSESIPFKEDDDLVFGNTTLSRWSYACSKAIDEFLGLAFYQQYSLPVVIGRFFNTIGPRQTGEYGMVVPRFVKSALKNEPLMIYGTGQQQRCFCYVDDVIDAVIELMDSDRAAGRVYNIGSSEEISIIALADKIISLTKSKSPKNFLSYESAYGRPIDDMMRRVPSTDRIRQTIGWQPTTTLDESLKIIIRSFK